MNLNNEHNKYTIADVINMYENDLEDYSMFKKLQQRAGSACYNSPADGGRSFFFLLFFLKQRPAAVWFSGLSSRWAQHAAKKEQRCIGKTACVMMVAVIYILNWHKQ